MSPRARDSKQTVTVGVRVKDEGTGVTETGGSGRRCQTHAAHPWKHSLVHKLKNGDFYYMQITSQLS